MVVLAYSRDGLCWDGKESREDAMKKISHRGKDKKIRIPQRRKGAKKINLVINKRERRKEENRTWMAQMRRIGADKMENRDRKEKSS